MSNSNPAQALATSRGDLRCTCGSWYGAHHNAAELRKSVPAEPEAKGCNVYLRPPLRMEGLASAFSLYGYQAAAAEVTIFAREGKGESRLPPFTVARATSIVILPDSDTWDPNVPFEFPEPLFFERPTSQAGEVEIGLRMDCFAGGGGFLFQGSECRASTFLTRMEVEWLWW